MPSQTQDFKNKMKVSNPLNDIAANLGVTPKVLTQLATGEDKEFRELVRGIFSILPENDVAVVAADAGINPQFLAYLSRLFEKNTRIRALILNNLSASKETRQDILDHLSEEQLNAVTANPATLPDTLHCISERFASSVDLMTVLLANPATPKETRESIQSILFAEEVADDDVINLDESQMLSSIMADDQMPEPSEVDAKIALCVDKLYEINAEVVMEFVKKARTEILKRLSLIAKANHLIMKTVAKHPDLTVDELNSIDFDLFMTLLKKMPQNMDDAEILALLRQARKSK